VFGLHPDASESSPEKRADDDILASICTILPILLIRRLQFIETRFKITEITDKDESGHQRFTGVYTD
jgi:hypothetical protein